MATSIASSSPRGSLFLGNLPDLMRDRTGFLVRCAREHGDVVPLRLGPKRVVLLSNPAHIETVLVTQSRRFVKPYVLRTSRVGLSVAPTSDGDIWQRPKLAQSAFHRARIAGYSAEMVAATERMLDSWQDGETRDILPEMMQLTLTIVAKTLFGADVTGQAAQVGAALSTVMDAFVHRLNQLFLIPDWLPTPTNVRLRRALRALDGMMDRVICEGLANGPHSGGLLAMLHTPGGTEYVDVADRRLRDEALTFFLAGHETVALALTWAWYLLARHPEAEAALHAELATELAGRTPTAANRAQLPYTEMVILEALRLYPPLWVMARVAREDVSLGGHAIPAGTLLLMSQWVSHRDPTVFVEPDAFQPERWADGLEKRLPRFAYFPFGGGTRGCIGSGFAMTEAIVLLATIAQRFALSLAPGQVVTPQPSITLRPAHGLRLRLARRPASALGA